MLRWIPLASGIRIVDAVVQSSRNAIVVGNITTSEDCRPSKPQVRE
jgi:hypothetical protein